MQQHPHENPQNKLTHAVDALDRDVEKLDDSIAKLDQGVEKLSQKLGFWASFGRGVVSALGYAVGATIIIGLIIYLLDQLSIFPIIGDWFQNLSDTLEALRQ